jgi:hypothetical protein
MFFNLYELEDSLSKHELDDMHPCQADSLQASLPTHFYVNHATYYSMDWQVGP